MLDGTADVHRYYSDRGDAYVVLASTQLKQVVTDWYVVNESAATLRQTGAIGDVAASDAEFVVQSVMLFPTAPDGIRGEIALTRYPFADVLAGRVEVPGLHRGDVTYLPVTELEHCRLLDRVVEGLARGDVRDLVTDNLITGDHRLAVRVDGPGEGARARFEAHDGDAASNALVELLGGADDLTLTGRIATDWYVFADYLARFDGGARLRHVAAIHPVRDGRLEGTFGYGFDQI